MKAKVGELGNGGREGFSKRLRKELTGVLESVSGKKMFLVRFQDGCEKVMTSNQLTIVTVDRIPVIEEYEVPTISTKHEKAVDLKKVYYHGISFYYSLISRMVLTENMTRQRFRPIQTRRRLRTQE